MVKQESGDDAAVVSANGHHGNFRNGDGVFAESKPLKSWHPECVVKSKRDELMETIRTAQAELEKLNQWSAGDRVVVRGVCEGYAADGSDYVLVQFDGSPDVVDVHEDALVREDVADELIEDFDGLPADVALAKDKGESVATEVATWDAGAATSPLLNGRLIAPEVNLADLKVRLEALRNKPHADHRDMPCASCEAAAVLELLEGLLVLPEVEKWSGVKASGAWVDISEIARRRVVAIEKDSALELAAALVKAAGAVEGVEE